MFGPFIWRVSANTMIPPISDPARFAALADAGASFVAGV
jgi:hypothetical protein